MAGVSTRRCPACGRVVLVADRGTVQTVGETRYVETRPNGDCVYRCICMELIVWQREPERVGK